MVTSFQVGLSIDRTELYPASVAPNARPCECVFRFRGQRRFGQRCGEGRAIPTLDRPTHDHLFCFTESCAGRLSRAAEDWEAGYCGRAVFLDRHFDDLFTEVALRVTR